MERERFFSTLSLAVTPTTPGVDEELIAAMKENGHVFIGGGIEINRADGQYSEQIIRTGAQISGKRPPAGACSFFVQSTPTTAFAVIYTGNEQKASLVWTVAEKLGAKIPDTPEERELKVRYMHYYGPAHVSSQCELCHGYRRKSSPTGYFKDKIVFVGGHVSMAKFGAGKDEFRNPWTARTIPKAYQSNPLVEEHGDFVPGVEVHATALTNLLQWRMVQLGCPKHRS